MFSWITAIPSLISGLFGTVNNITNAISNEKIAALNATTDQDRIRSDERIKTLEARRDVLVAESGVSKINIVMRSLMAMSVVVVLWKLLVWDKVIGSFMGCSGAARGTCGIFTTDQFDANQWQIIMAVVGFYFLYEAGIGITKIIKR